MKKSILLFALTLAGVSAFAQNTYNLVIFSEDGEPFYAYVNGIRQNDKPETNIKVTNLNSEALNMRIQFDNKALPTLKQNMVPEFGYEHTVNIKKNVKKVMKLQYFGKVPLNQAPQGSATTVQYHTSENAVSDNSGSNSQFNTSDNGGSNTTVTTTSTSVQPGSNLNNGSININMGGTGVSMNVNGLDGSSYNSTTSTTVSSSSSSSSSSNNAYGQGKPNRNGVTTQTSTQTTGNGGCIMAMNQAAYDKMKASIEAKPFSDTKMSTAKVATKNACLSAAQVKGICALFSMDDDKLAYAKYAYDYCADKANYYQVSEAFSFSTTTDELNKYLEEH